MESGSSGAASLMRPRVAVAAVAAAATVTLGVGLYLTHGRHALPVFLGGGSGDSGGRRTRGRLHRQNAVRRLRRRRRANGRPSARGHHHDDDDDDDAEGVDDDAIDRHDGHDGQGNSHVAGDGWAMDEGTDEPNDYEPSRWELDGEAAAPLGGGPIGAGRLDGTGDNDNDVTLGDFWMDEPQAQPVPSRDGQNIIGLLFRVSEDNARRSAYVHRGCACNACGVVPIRGIRYRCANCADFDLCETCELQGLHNKTHVFYKVRVPAPPFGTRQVAQPVWYAGDPDLYQQQVPRSLIGRLMRETGFERQELEAYWEQWTYMANTEWREDPDELGLAMDRTTFERCLVPSGGARRHGAANLIHDRMFAFYDTNGDGLIGFREYLHGLTYRKRKDKLRRIFDGYDTDGDGLVSRRDFLRFFRAYYVLYKQMHRDILDGFDDALNSVETHRHTTGRQPLSSMFGRDSTVPPADLQRMLPGKVIFGDTAEVGVADAAQGVRCADATDTATRQDVLARLFMHPTRQRRAPLGARTLGGRGGGGSGGGASARAGHSANAAPASNPVSDENGGSSAGPGFRSETAEHRYLEALVDPPMTVGDLPGLLVGEQVEAMMTEERFSMYLVGRDRHNDETMEDFSAVGGGPADDKAAEGEGDGEDEGAGSGAGDGNRGFSVPPPRWAGVPLDSGLRQGAVAAAAAASRAAGHVGGTPLRLTRGQISAQNAAYVDRRLAEEAKVAARQRLLQRWQQRHFYLDEEEGASPPPGWQDDEDVLARAEYLVLGGRDEGTGTQTRSRSSSRVRFADDNNDNDKEDTVPPGAGMTTPPPPPSLPEAERDAGHEVMYQVMQQAFNELLDIMFLEKEAMAVEAAETKAQREQWRHLSEHPMMDYMAWEGESLRAPTDAAHENERLEPPVQGRGEGAGADSEIPLSFSLAAVPAERDPTLPQFRQGNKEDKDDSKENGGNTIPANVPWESLRDWHRIDHAEAEARADGGWGRLRFEEFERICQREELGSNRLDYLGSWIDFCIP